jgi:ATP-dependent Clp protease ATP-binding subunit ClpB
MSPTGRILDTTRVSELVRQMQEKFASRIVGQSDAVSAMTDVLENFHGGFRDANRPVGSLLFLGPTGTGKTRAVEALCEGLFSFKDAMIKVDCGEFQHSHEIAKLIGSPPGYLGHRETPARFTQKQLDAYSTPELPLSIVLFDEIEKACDELWHLLLGILDKGKLTIGDNSTISFKNTIIIMTSNIGASQMATATDGTWLGFQTPTLSTIPKFKLEDIALSAARRKFTPEFLNRLDKIVMFNTLTREQVTEIMGLELGFLQSKVYAKNSSRLCPSPAALDEIIRRGYSAKYNARELRRTIDKEIMLPIARAISTRQVKEAEDIVIGFEDGKFVFFAKENEWHSLPKFGSPSTGVTGGNVGTATTGTESTRTTSRIVPPAGLIHWKT